MQILDRQRAQQAAEDTAKKAALAARNLVDATKEAEEASIAAATAAAVSAPEEAQVSLSGSTATAACLLLCAHVSDCPLEVTMTVSARGPIFCLLFY